MKHPLTLIIAYFIAVVIAWYPFNKLLIWTASIIVPPGIFPQARQTPSALASRIGGLERSLYIFAVMADQNALITGWLVMKAFFGRISTEMGTVPPDQNRRDLHLIYYTNYLIVNLLFLLIGLAIGIIVLFVLDHFARFIDRCLYGAFF